jgi:hypothetical protein
MAANALRSTGCRRGGGEAPSASSRPAARRRGAVDQRHDPAARSSAAQGCHALAEQRDFAHERLDGEAQAT